MGVLDSLREVEWGKWPLPHFKPFTSTQCQWGLWQYVLVCSYVMGLQALYDFPLCLHRYTALFLVAYFITLLLFCIPLVYVQLKIGAVLQRHIVDLYGNCIPALKGLPWAMLSLSFLVCVYQSIYVAYGLQYAFLSTKPSYPWGQKYNYTSKNLGGHIYLGEYKADTYFNKVFLDKSPLYGSAGEVRLRLVFTLALVWILLFLFTCRGPRMYGRIFPVISCVGLVCLFSTMFYTQSGVVDVTNSLSNYLTNMHHTSAENSDGDTSSSVLAGLHSSPLSSPMTWIKALEQNIYNLALWCGVLPALGSYVGDRKHVNKITPVVLLVAHVALPLLLSLTVIPLVNGLAVTTDTPLPNIMQHAQTGDLLWFVVIPEALHLLDTSHFWAFMLYTAFSVLLLHQQSVLLLAILENLRSTFQKELVPIFRRQEAFVSAVCALGFLLGLPMVTQGGYYVLHTVQVYLYRGLFVLVLLSVIPAAYVYVKLDPIYMPIERKFITGWFLAASTVVAVILMYNDNVVVNAYVTYKEYTVPYMTIGQLTAVAPILICLLIGLGFAIFHTQEGTFIEKLQEIITPSMARIYPPVLNTEPIDLHFAQFRGTLKTNNRFAKKGKEKSNRAGEKTQSPTKEETSLSKEAIPLAECEDNVADKSKETERPKEEPMDNIKPYKLESTVPTDDLCQTPIDTEVCIEGLEHATPV